MRIHLQHSIGSVPDRAVHICLWLFWCRLSKSFAAARRVKQSTESVVISRDAPSLGKFQSQFTIDSFVAAGGQANVYIGTQASDQQKVILRFPRGMCEGTCTVGDLDNVTLEEMRTSCALSIAAIERFEQLPQPLDDETIKNMAIAHVDNEDIAIADDDEFEWPLPPYSRCIKGVSLKDSDPAFEVWSMAGEFTIAERFFLSIGGEPLTIGQKRRILGMLREAVGKLADETTRTEPCCCLKKNPVQCSAAPKQKTDFKHMIQNPNKIFDNMFTNPTPKSDIMRIMTKKCPSDMVESPGKCGALVHHDIKFENVMLVEQNDSQGHRITQPVIIDFGAASRCSKGYATGYSANWVPAWQRDPLVLPATCWSYDIFAVGMIALVTELLVNLPSNRLLFDAATKAGIIPNITARNKKIPVRGVLSSYTIPHASWQFRQDALIPVNLLVEGLRNEMLKPGTTDNVDSFISFVRRFVSDEKRPPNLRSLPLTMPDDWILKEEVWPLLQECPLFPSVGRSSMWYYNAKQATFKCRLQAAKRRLDQALSTHEGNESIARYTKNIHDACQKVWEQDRVRPQEQKATDAYCGNQQSDSLVRIVSQGTLQELEQFFNATVSSHGLQYAHELLKQQVLDGDTVLAIAARRRLLEMTVFLLQHGADPLRRFTTRETAENVDQAADTLAFSALLASATIPDNVAVLKSLLNAGMSSLLQQIEDLISPSVPTKLVDETFSGALRGHLYVGGAHDNFTRERFGASIVDLIAEQGDAGMLRVVIDMLNIRTRPEGWLAKQLVIGIKAEESPLLRAAAAGKAKMCELLLQEGANVTAYDNWGRTAFMLAVKSLSVPTIKVIAAARPEALNEQVRNFGTPLHVAALIGDVSVVQTLLDLGVDPVQTNLQGDTPLHDAVRKGNVPRIIDVLARLSETQGARNYAGQTPLVLAASLCKSTEDFQIILDAAADDVLEMRDNLGYLATHAAAAEGQIECLKLVAKRIPISKQAMLITGSNYFYGQTPFIVAAKRGQVPAMKELLKLGASASETDSKGRPAGMLIGWRQDEMLYDSRSTLEALASETGPSFLLQRDSIGMSVFGRFVFDGDFDMVEFLMNQSYIGCESVALQLREDVPREMVEQFVGPNDWYSPVVYPTFSPLKLVLYRLATYKLKKWNHKRDDSYLEARPASPKGFPWRSNPTIEDLHTLSEYLVTRGCTTDRSTWHKDVARAFS